LNRLVVKTNNCCNIQEPRNARTRPIAMIFGTKVMVTSLICVAACTRLIRLPTNKDTSNTGAASTSITVTEFCARERTYDSVMPSTRKTDHQGADDQIPPID